MTSVTQSRAAQDRRAGGGYVGGGGEDTDRTFPGRVVAGVCLILCPIFGVVASLLAINVYKPHAAEFVRGMQEHHSLAEAGFNLDMVAVVMAMFAVIFIAGKITRERPGLGRAAGVLTVIGLFGPVFFVGIYFGASQVTGADGGTTATTLVSQAQSIPGTIMNVSGPALVIGFVLLGVGAIRTGVLSRVRGWALALGLLLPAGFISGVIVISAIGFLAIGIAFVPLGVQLLSGRSWRSALHGGSSPRITGLG